MEQVSAKPQKYMVCHDGSEASQAALDTVEHSLLRNCDKLMVGHAWSRDKEEYLKYNLKRDYVKQQLTANGTYLADRFSYVDREIVSDNHESAKSILGDLANEFEATITVVGMHGRKGPKEDPTIMGSSVQYMAMQSPLPVMIIKDPKSRKNRPEGFLMAVCSDGSKKSLEGLALMCKLRSPQDKIYVIICEQGNLDSGKIKDTISFDLEERECLQHAHIEIIKSQYGVKTKDLIREHITSNKDLYIDYIFVGNQGADYSG